MLDFWGVCLFSFFQDLLVLGSVLVFFFNGQLWGNRIVFFLNDTQAHGYHMPCVVRKWTLPVEGLENAPDPFLDWKVISRIRLLSVEEGPINCLRFLLSLSDQDEGYHGVSTPTNKMSDQRSTVC